MGWLVILVSILATFTGGPELEPCVIDATVRTVVAKDATTLYTVDRNGRREHFTVDPIIVDITNVGDHYSTPTDCVQED